MRLGVGKIKNEERNLPKSHALFKNRIKYDQWNLKEHRGDSTHSVFSNPC